MYRAEGAVTDPKDFTLDAARLKFTGDPGRACLYDAGHFDELAGVYRLACTSSAAVRFKVCVAATGSTPGYQDHDYLRAYVTIADERTCLFQSEETPCTNPACEDAGSDGCAQATAEYCTFFPEDKGCEFIAMLFKRRQFEKNALRFHATVLTPRLLGRVQPDAWLVESDRLWEREAALQPGPHGRLALLDADYRAHGALAGSQGCPKRGTVVNRRGRPPTGPQRPGGKARRSTSSAERSPERSAGRATWWPHRRPHRRTHSLPE